MKRLGMIGGIGPESTVDYYKLLIAEYRRQQPDGAYPSILINSIDLNKMVGMAEAGDWPGVTEYLVAEIQRLAKAGADFGFLSANTPHKVLDDIRPRSPIPLVSIVEAACDKAKSLGLKKLGLFGTRFTMQGEFYPDVFSRSGIALVVPGADDQSYIHDKYMNELLRGTFLPETHDGLLAIAKKMKAGQGIEALILGGTELPLILRDSTPLGIPFLDTTQIHVQAIVEKMLE